MSRHNFNLFTIAAVLWAACGSLGAHGAPGAPGARGLEPRAPVIKPPHTQLQPWHRGDSIDVKFKDGLPIRLRGGGLSDLGSGHLLGAQQVLDQVAGGSWRRSYDVAEAALDQLRATAQANLGRAVADLNTCFNLVLPPGADAVAIIDAFNALDIVELAEPAPLPPPSPGPCLLLDSYQGYHNPGPAGLNSLHCWEIMGTRGSGVNIVDCEYGFNALHFDLPAIQVVGPAPDPNVPNNEIQHGTAVMGILGGLDDCGGITGMASDAALRFAAVQVAGAWNAAAAIINATANTQPGDVILIEQQWFGPSYNPGNGTCPGQFGMVPVEWRLAEYNAIVTAVGNGRIVIEAAGNGAQNLDAAIYSQGNMNHWPFLPQNDSGAIIVGAGWPGPSFFGTDVDLSRMVCSNYGSRVDVQGWGTGIFTSGYGDYYGLEGPNLYYTRLFGGTSGASAQVAAAAALLQSAHLAATGNMLSPAQVRSSLVNTGSPQQAGIFPVTQNIGPRPDAAFAIMSFLGGCVPLLDTAVGSPGLNNYVDALLVFDDGNGEALYAGGNFTSAGGAPAFYVARWDGSSWSPLGVPPAPIAPGPIYDFAVFDGGSGPELYAGGFGGVVRWTGSGWVTPGSGIAGTVVALAVYDDGSGPKLYAGGNFTQAGGGAANYVARWNGSSWSALGSGMDSIVLALEVFDDGNGARLYAGGGFTTAGGNSANYLARWNGSAWSAVGPNTFNGNVYDLHVFDDGSGDALFAAGVFWLPGGTLVKWDGQQFTGLVNVGVNTFALGDFDDGSGPALYVGGPFPGLTPLWAPGIFKWDGADAWAVGDGVNGTTSAFAVFDDGNGPALYAGGTFQAAYDLPVGRIVKLSGCPVSPPCPADLDGDGAVGVTDFLALLSAWGPCPAPPASCPADLDGDGAVGVTDFLALLSAWGPCP